MDAKVFKDILDQLNRGGSPTLDLHIENRRYIRRFENGDRLILLGCGHVSLDVYRMARLLDFRVTAVDDRPDFANSTRFPEAEVICDSFSHAIERLQITAGDYVCVLTRGHRWDRECITAILSAAEMPFYLGLISSGRRAEGLKASLAEEGFDPQRIARIHAPVGLPIDAGTTAEIALSICAEMIAEKRRACIHPAENELLQRNVNPEMLRFLARADEPRAMLVVLGSSGSTPVKSGSMMAVNALGKGFGTIGGGCSEAAAVSKARQIIAAGGSAVLDFDMSDDAAAEDGMVCGGTMQVLIECIE